ncbi:5051_t:CDS:1, partial [Cetraspora pellucida]
QLYPTITFSVAIYNYLLNKLEDIIDDIIEEPTIQNAANAAKLKILKYYPYTDRHIYTIAT